MIDGGTPYRLVACRELFIFFPELNPFSNSSFVMKCFLYHDQERFSAGRSLAQ